MQTFLPSKSFEESARALDNRRLGNQRLEAKVILKTLCGLSTAWRNHPAVRMWRDYEHALVRYAIAICLEWRRRGFQDRQLLWFAPLLSEHGDDPPWLGDERLHASHRSSLLRKKPEHYSVFGWEESSKLSYFWPVKADRKHVIEGP